MHCPVLPVESILWMNNRSFSFLPSKGGDALTVGIVSEVFGVPCWLYHIIPQKRNTEVWNSTALTRILCFVDVLILRIAFYDSCYHPLLPGFFWIWEIRHSLKADFWPPRLPNFWLSHLILQRNCVLQALLDQQCTVYSIILYLLSS